MDQVARARLPDFFAAQRTDQCGGRTFELRAIRFGVFGIGEVEQIDDHHRLSATFGMEDEREHIRPEHICHQPQQEREHHEKPEKTDQATTHPDV